MLTYSNYTDFHDIEFAMDTWQICPQSSQTGPWPSDVPGPSEGGMCSRVGIGNRYYNNCVHWCSEGCSSEIECSNEIFYGNLFYDNGWNAPDRGHGHCAYIQNRDPNKVFSNNYLYTRGLDGQLACQAYGTGGTWIDHFWLEDNIAVVGSEFLLGGGATVHDGHVNRNVSLGVPFYVGYPLNQSAVNGDCEVTNNYMANTNFTIWWFTSPTYNNNTIINGSLMVYDPCNYNPHTTAGGSTPSAPAVFLKTNMYDPTRGNLCIIDWNNAASVQVNLSSIVPNGTSFQLLDPRNYYGTPLFQGSTDSSGNVSIPIPVGGSGHQQYNAYVVRAGQSTVNLAPLVDAGSDQTITLPTNVITLAGNVTDDGLPTGSTVTHTWTQTSGPAATIANPGALTTTATITATGAYVFRLTASDSNLSNYDEMTVLVSLGSVLDNWLKFDDGSGTVATDSSGNARNGTLVNNPSWITGKVGGALQFNGTSNYVQVTKFALNPSFSVAMWFKPTAGSLTGSNGGYHYMFSWGPALSADGIALWCTTATEPGIGCCLRAFAADDNDSNFPDSSAFTLADANVHFNDGNWHHVALTVSKTNGRRVYLDGSLKANDTGYGGDYINPASDIFIGGRYDKDSSRFFNGGVDDVRIYDKELSSSEVTALLTSTPQNQAPTITMPANPMPAMPNAANAGGVALNATVTDDGLPSGSTVAVTWSVLSAPANGVVVFTNANAASTTASFTRVGAYQLQLLATDSNLSTTATMTVTVKVDPRADYDKNGVTDGLDFLAWQRNYNHGTAASGAPILDANFSDPNYAKANGDANGDGKVDGQDYLIWQQGYMYCH